MNMRFGIAACSALAVALMFSIAFAEVNEKRVVSPFCPVEPDLKSNGPYASVSSTGVLAQGCRIVATVTGVRRITTGQYSVQTTRDIRKCAYIATIGEPGAGLAGFGSIQTTLMTGTTDTVLVKTANVDGQASDRAFHLHVVCQ